MEAVTGCDSVPEGLHPMEGTQVVQLTSGKSHLTEVHRGLSLCTGAGKSGRNSHSEEEEMTVNSCDE